MHSVYYWLWLQHALGAGSRKVRDIHQAYGGPAEFYEKGPEHWKSTGWFTSGELRALGSCTPQGEQQVILDCKRLGYRIMTPEHPDYPDRFLNMPDYPAAIYVCGEFERIDEKPLITVVGTRNISSYGREVTSRICDGLSRAGMVIVSGGAYGVDTVAHNSALSAGGKTIAVLPCGINTRQLVENVEMREKIARTGALISEYPPGAPCFKESFPIRNRLLAALSLGTLVVEAGEKSGALITANWALELGRDVFAVPGSVMNPYSVGCNRLISQGAKPVTCAMDVLEEYLPRYPRQLSGRVPGLREMPSVIPQERVPSSAAEQRETRKAPAAAKRTEKKCPAKAPEKIAPASSAPEISAELSEDARAVAALLTEPLHVNVLAERSGLPMSRVLSALTELELEGVAHAHPGRIFSR